MANQNGKIASAIHCRAQISFSSKQAKENTRDKCDKKAYEKKNADGGHHYDHSRKKLNFCIVKGSDGKPVIKPLSELTAEILMQRYVNRLAELNFKAYNEGSKVHANSYVDWVFGGDHNRMCELAFGKQEVDFTLEHDNSHVKSMPDIEAWAMDVYEFACEKFGEENIFGFEVHLDETTPHAHLNLIPVARHKTRGRASYLYARKDDMSKTITSAEYRKLNSSTRKDYIKTDKQERTDKDCVSYSGLMGETREERGQFMRNFHTEFYEKVGKKYGLERGDFAEDLTDKQRAQRRHKSASELEEEHLLEEDREEKEQELKALDEAIAERRNEKENLDKVTGLGAKMQKLFGFGDSAENEQRVLEAEQRADTAERQASEAVSQMNTAVHDKERAEQSAKDVMACAEQMEKDANDTKKIAEQMKAQYDATAEDIRASVVTEMRKGYASERNGKTPPSDYDTPYKLGQYAGQLRTEKEKVAAENKSLVATKNENDALKSKVEQMQSKVNDYDRMSNAKDAAESAARYYSRSCDVYKQRAEQAESELKFIRSFPEITDFLEQVQKNIAAFKKQLTTWIADARKTIREFANLDNHRHDFSESQQQSIFMGILAKAHMDGLDATDKDNRHTVTDHLMQGINWSGTTDYRMDLARTRTFQFSDFLQKILTQVKATIQFFTQCASGHASVSESLGSNGAANTLSDWRGNSITTQNTY